MKRTFYSTMLLIGAVMLSMTMNVEAATPKKQKKEKAPRWKLVWKDNFKKDGFIDSTKWSKIPRGGSDWNNYMSSRDDLYEVKDGNLILKGIVNDRHSEDTAAYLTGGLWTKDKFSVQYGKIEIRAKMESSPGAWPAFWMLAQDQKYGPYPKNGEVDIMEHLNYDSVVYQTIHSHYTLNLNQQSPKRFVTVPIDSEKYNTYGVEFYPDKLIFTLNGKPTLVYPKIETEHEGQFPFDQPYYLLLDMQLGGSWVGGVDSTELPVQMDIDWVRVWKQKSKY